MTDHPTIHEPTKDVLSESPQSPLANPDLLRVLGTLLASPQSTRTEQADDRPKAAMSASTGAGDGLAALLSNPEMMEKLPQLISVIKPMLGTLSPTIPPTPSHAASPDADRDRLLLALKPFLSQKRCEAIDNMLRIGKLGSVLQGLK